MTFLVMLFAHLLADYPLQGDFLSRGKGSNPILMFAHCGIWTGCVAIAAYFCGVRIDLSDIVFLFGVHAFADQFKASGWYDKMARRPLNPLGLPLLIDQAIHANQILYLLCVHKN